MEQAILTKDQKTVLQLFAANNEIAPLFYLTGGTALAEFYLGHRYSDDLDFFTEIKEFPQFTVERFAQDIKVALAAEKVEYRRLYDRRIFFFRAPVAELKVEFTYYPFARIEQSSHREGVTIDSLQDMAANKLMALFDRIEAKDFVDIYFIVKENLLTLDNIVDLVRKKFSFSFDPVVLGSEFAKVRALTELPRMVKPLSLDELKMFFAERAKELAPRILEE